MRAPERHSLGFVTVAGDSMWPTLRTGDAVLCEPVAAATPGDIVVAKLPHGVIAHRVVRWSANEVVLRGDTALSNDAAVSAELVLGRVIKVRRSGVEHAVSDVDLGRRLLGRARVRLKGLLSRVARRAP